VIRRRGRKRKGSKMEEMKRVGIKRILERTESAKGIDRI